ncbi:MAG: S-layer homology domain-containing protein [Clostridia bacterium]|nr:S-layer homology domain-containing protein [Clostridia bacterium]
MKRFTRFFSLILALCMVLPMTVLGAVPDYKDVPKDHWAYDSIMSLTEKGMVEGKVAGVRFDPEAPLRNTELFMTLYRLAGEPEVVPTFEFRGNLSDEDIISGKYGIELAGDDKYGTSHLRGKWYRDAAFWAAYNGLLVVNVCTVGNNYVEGMGSHRVGNDNYSMPEVGTTFNDYDCYSVLINLGIDLGTDYTTTRTDMIVALYLYVTEYLKKEIVIDNTTETFEDSAKIPANVIDIFENLSSTPLYIWLGNIGEEHIWADAWNWGVGAGIIEGYPDNTLRPAANLTRAEYAEILERFMDYVK